MEVELGQKVKYARLNVKGERETGEGFVVSIFLSPDRRKQVGIMVGKERYNIDLPAINPTPAGITRYFEHIAAVTELANTLNLGIRKMTEDGNAQIEGLNNSYFGDPIECNL